MGWKLAAFIGIVLILGTASLIFLPFSADSKSEKDGLTDPFRGTFQNMRSAEGNMLDFIQKEKAEISAQLPQLSFP